MSAILTLAAPQAERLPKWHPDKAQLLAFMRGELPRREVKAIVRHLLTGCTSCIRVTRRLWELGERVPGEREAER